MNYLTDQIHALGMKAGIVSDFDIQPKRCAQRLLQYSDSGWFTCQLYPGSYQNEARFVQIFYRAISE
jgi:alpha-galactosidase